MLYTHLAAALDEAVPDERVIADVRRVLAEGAENDVTQVEIDDAWLPVPVNVSMEVITKIFYRQAYEDTGFGRFRVLVAIGGFQRVSGGFHRAGICFATVFYNVDGGCITIDFHSDYYAF